MAVMERREFCKSGIAGIGALAFSGTIKAMEYSLNAASEKKKWVVLYGSQCGSTREYANFINEGLGDIADVVDIAQTTPGINEYEHFIIGGWRNANSVMPAAIPEFINTNKVALKEKIRGVFVVLGNGGDATLSGQLTKFLNDKMVTPLGVSNLPAKVLFGRSDPQCSGFPMSYDNVSKEAGVDFGKSIQATSTHNRLSNMSNTFELFGNYPNPFNLTTTIRYNLPEACDVVLSIKTLNGREITRLVSGRQVSGTHEVTWNARGYAPGYYLYQLNAGGFKFTRTAIRVDARNR